MKEADLLNWVLAVARQFGWKPFHVPAPMRASRSGQWVPAREAKGLPDLVLLHDDPPRLILAELKGDGGKLTDEQTEFLRLARGVVDDLDVWLDRASEAGYDDAAWERPFGVYVWTPADRDTIETILRGNVLI